MVAKPKSPESEKSSGGKKRQRSPNYPAVSLRNAVERARKLYAADGRPGSTIEGALRHLGFSGSHGQAMTVLSALKKFGLIEDKAGRIVPTKLAVDVFEFSEDHERHRAALRQMVLNPGIYLELVDQFREHGRLPSDASLKPELVTDMGFNPKAVTGFLADFRDSLEYAGLLVGNELKLSTDTGDGPSAPRKNEESFGFADSIQEFFGPIGPNRQRQQAEVSRPKPAIESGRAMRDLTLPLMDDEIAFLRVPVPLSEENYEYLVQQIAVLKRGLVARKIAPPSPDSPTSVTESAGLGTSASVPFMLTHEMRRKLLGLGFSPAQISEMTPQEAWDVINRGEQEASGS